MSPSAPAANDPNIPSDEALVQRLKSSLHLPLGQLVDSTTLELGTNATPQFIGTLTELVYAQIENIAQDLEAFARHRGAKRIEVRDVMLLGRRNEGLKGMLEEEAARIKKRMGKERGGANGNEKDGDNSKRKARTGVTDGGINGKRGELGRGKGKGKGKRPNMWIDDEADEDEDDGSQAEDVEGMEMDNVEDEE